MPLAARRYVALVTLPGLALTAALLTLWSAPDIGWAAVALLAAVAAASDFPVFLIGPAKIIYTLSGPFLLTLMLVGPPGPAVLVVVVVALVEFVVVRRSFVQCAFNVAAPVLALSAAKAVLALLTSHAFGSGGTLHPGDLLAVAAAGLTFWAVNTTLNTLVFSLSTGAPLTASAGGAAAVALSVLDVGLTPVVVAAAQFHALLIAGCVAPFLVLAWSLRQAEAQERRALHDVLTGLPNRAALARSFSQWQTDPRGPRRLALLVLDLDRFKPVNDTLGHQAGDELLQQVAQRLRREVRSADTVARLGGDEFAVLVAGTEPMQDHGVEALASRLVSSLAAPFALTAGEVSIGTSIGIAYADDEGVTPEELTRRADAALYEAKRQRNGWCVHRPAGEQANPVPPQRQPGEAAPADTLGRETAPQP